jgi:hypothetical protein
MPMRRGFPSPAFPPSIQVQARPSVLARLETVGFVLHRVLEALESAAKRSLALKSASKRRIAPQSAALRRTSPPRPRGAGLETVRTPRGRGGYAVERDLPHLPFWQLGSFCIFLAGIKTTAACEDSKSPHARPLPADRERGCEADSFLSSRGVPILGPESVKPVSFVAPRFRSHGFLNERSRRGRCPREDRWAGKDT